jgi:hypothetical protein
LTLFKSLVAAFAEQPAEGWIRASAAASEDLLNQINDLRIRNEQLEKDKKRLTEELAPKIENIAAFDSGYPVYYTYRVLSNREYITKTSYLTLTWREIFSAIGPEIMQARSPSLISKILAKYMKERKGITRAVLLQSATLGQIKIQLAALGLIRIFQGKSTSGALAEWVQITSVGQKRLFESLVIRENESGSVAKDALCAM